MCSHKQRIVALVSVFVLMSCAAIVTGCSEEIVCFTAGTRIETPTGLTRIEELKVGDSILSVDPLGGVMTRGTVQSIGIAVAHKYVDVQTESGVHVGVTEHHPFWVESASGFVPIGKLKVGTQIGVWSKGKMASDRIARARTVSGQIEVYHLVVDRPPHTFVAEGLIVHNKPPVPPPNTSVVLTVSPADAGWITNNGRFFGGRDTVFFSPVGYNMELEAVPRVGWVFDHWNGTVNRTDTFVTYLNVQLDAWAECVFDTVTVP